MVTLNEIIFSGIILAIIVLCVTSTKIVLDSSIHSNAEKQKMVLQVWLLPVLGALLAVSRLKADAVRNRELSDQALVNRLEELTEKIETMRTQIEKEKKRKMH